MQLQEVHRQLKEQFMHGMNGSGMLAEIISELTKNNENVMIPSE